MRQAPRKKQGEHFWPRIVLRKWLNRRSRAADFGADADEGDAGGECEYEEEMCRWDDEQRRVGGDHDESNATSAYDNYPGSMPYRMRRRKSETFRAQYINTKEIRMCVGTWNVGGKIPSDDLDIAEWVEMEEPADIYVLGLQEIVPLNAGNIFGAEDSSRVPRWEDVIREALNRIQPGKPKYKSYSNPSSPSRFKPSDDAPHTVDDLLLDTDSDSDVEVHPLDEQSSIPDKVYHERSGTVDDLKLVAPSSWNSVAHKCTSQESDQLNHCLMKKLNRRNHLSLMNYEATSDQTESLQEKIPKMLSCSERIGLVWPEQPLDLLSQSALSNPNSFQSVKPFRACTTFKQVQRDYKDSMATSLVPELNMDAFKKKRSPFVRILSKQMIGIFLSVWVRRSVRKHVQNLKVSTVGVGAMGYIGNKGSISVSLSIYQTLCCFICSHLSSGEKEGDDFRRNADVHEIHRRTQFNSVPGMGLPKAIHDHERIIWLGDLNYRINLSNNETHELISKRRWFELFQKDQLKQELMKGRAFDGWSEGVINFPPTYKYEFNAEKYVGEDPKPGRRTPAWCDRILSFGRGLRLLSYRRSELKLSDHRPVTAVFMVEVEVFSHRKLQMALTLTDAEIEHGELLSGNFEQKLSDLSSKRARKQLKGE